jgi:UDP-N-acetylmuramate dehydrogenase
MNAPKLDGPKLDGPKLDGLARCLAPIARVSRDAASAPLTTYRVGGSIGLLVEVESLPDLLAVSATLGDVAASCRVIGRGSNLLVADEGFPGVVVRLGVDFESVDCRADLECIRAGGAAPLPVLARQSAIAGLRGLEFFVGIPGTVGGAVRMNAGGHGTETVDMIESATLLTIGTSEPVVVSRADLALGFRCSAVRSDQVVVAAEFRGAHGDAAMARAEIDEVVRWRRANQPGGQNCGSVFVNPVGDSAGRVIDGCGLKGARVGGAIVSEKHANFIQAEPGATAADVLALIEHVRVAVFDATGIELRTELCVLGDESEGPPSRASEVRA